MEKVMLHVQDITCGYDSRIILKNLSFKVSEGEVVGIIGPNGSGKTTLIRAVSKAIPLTGGSIKFKDRDMQKMDHRGVAREIAVVPQISEESLFFVTVEEFILLGRIPHFDRFQWFEKEKDREIVEESMQLVDVSNLRDREIHRLSGGELQRVFIARALAQNPKLLLLDEPTSHLDINHRIEIFKLIGRLVKEKSITVISVLHDLNLASKYCQRIILLNKGEIAYQGSPKEVIKKEYIEKVYSARVNIYSGELSDTPQIIY